MGKRFKGRDCTRVEALRFTGCKRNLFIESANPFRGWNQRMNLLVSVTNSREFAAITTMINCYWSWKRKCDHAPLSRVDSRWRSSYIISILTIAILFYLHASHAVELPDIMSSPSVMFFLRIVIFDWTPLRGKVLWPFLLQPLKPHFAEKKRASSSNISKGCLPFFRCYSFSFLLHFFLIKSHPSNHFLTVISTYRQSATKKVSEAFWPVWTRIALPLCK